VQLDVTPAGFISKKHGAFQAVSCQLEIEIAFLEFAMQNLLRQIEVAVRGPISTGSPSTSLLATYPSFRVPRKKPLPQQRLF